MNDRKATFTSRPISSPSNDSESSTQVPHALAPRPLAVALRRVLGGGLLAVGLISPALGQNPSLELSDLDGNNGFALDGSESDTRSGQSVSGAGDVNGDGVDDILIGRNHQIYMVFGTSGGFPAVLYLSDLDGSNGFVLNGPGASVSGAGDVNGDGVDDIIIGAVASDRSYVVFGSSGGFPAAVELSDLDGSNGFVLKGSAADDFLGYSVSGAGDVNGDGVDDLLIGVPQADPNDVDRAGQSYVVFGTSGGFPAVLETSVLDGSNGFALNGIAAGDNLGRSVSGAGDVNGDGVDDIIIGAPLTNSNGDYSGQSYVVFGTSGGVPAAVELSALDGSNGFALNGIAARDQAGRSVSGVGDVNGDGFDDLLIGTLGVQSYVVFGTGGGFPATVELSALDGNNGFALNGIAAGDSFGTSVSGAGDVNEDGFDDLLIGAPGASPNGLSSAGQGYVVFGTGGGFPAVLEVSDLDGSNGFALNGSAAYDNAGNSVSGAGDVNGDGIDDVLIKAPDDAFNGNYSGRSYVVFGTASAGGVPAALLKALITDVEALDLPAGLERWLARPLKSAEKKLAQVKVAKALYKVVGFIQRARVLRKYGILPAAEANALIVQAKTLIKALLELPQLSGVAASDLLPADLIPMDEPVPAGPSATTR